MSAVAVWVLACGIALTLAFVGQGTRGRPKAYDNELFGFIVGASFSLILLILLYMVAWRANLVFVF